MWEIRAWGEKEIGNVDESKIGGRRRSWKRAREEER
uniref:Uncharacterized protein n=1 Tax=Cucumis melo TaxID=3656 RepID=A0A9I9EL55_CUCME